MARLASKWAGRQTQLLLYGRNYVVCSSICVLLLCPVSVSDSVATAAALSASAVDVELAVRCTPLLG